jgi:hypothetical protein
VTFRGQCGIGIRSRIEQRDFRGLGRVVQEGLRARAVYLVIEEGKSQGEAAAAVGVSRQVV